MRSGSVLIVILLWIKACAGQMQADGYPVEQCCETIFISARGAIEQSNSILLGKYKLNGIHANRPVYYKSAYGLAAYFFYKETGTIGKGSPGWVVGESINGSTLYIATRHTAEQAACPDGIRGAYDIDKTLDESFYVKCYDENSFVPCCREVNVTASYSGPVGEHHAALLGHYKSHSTFNGHPMYHLRQYNLDFYLHFRMKGRSGDGWTFSLEPGKEAISVTTRSQEACPGGIHEAYDRDMPEGIDESFSIECIPGTEPVEVITEPPEIDSNTPDNGNGSPGRPTVPIWLWLSLGALRTLHILQH